MVEEDIRDLAIEIEEFLIAIKEEQAKIRQDIESNHKVNMKNFSRLREYNEISDMTNQIFERRISNMEKMLEELLKKY